MFTLFYFFLFVSILKRKNFKKERKKKIRHFISNIIVNGFKVKKNNEEKRSLIKQCKEANKTNAKRNNINDFFFFIILI